MDRDDFCDPHICDRVEGRNNESELLERYWRTFFCVLKSHKSPCENMAQQAMGGSILCHYGIVREIVRNISLRITHQSSLAPLVSDFFGEGREVKKNRHQDVERLFQNSNLEKIVTKHRRMIQRYLQYLLFISHQTRQELMDFQIISGETLHISPEKISRLIYHLLKQTKDAWGDLC